MADVNRGDRPLSPHLQVYRPQITSVLSIFHRVTGIGMAVAAVLIVWWLLAASTGPAYFATADAALTSWLGVLVLFLATWALCFHLLNGVRHLWWDTGGGFALDAVTKSGQAVVAGSFLLTIVIWLAV